MAIILAAQNGNWSSTSTWTGGVIPVSGDIAVINNKSVTIDVNVICDSIIRDSTGGATVGGTVTVNPNLAITANINAGNFAGANQTFFQSTLVSGQTVTINGSITGGQGAGGSYGFQLSGTGGSLNINGEIIGGFNSTTLFIFNNGAVVNIIGDICRNTANGATGIDISGSATVNITGNVYGSGTAGGVGFGIWARTAGSVVNITGNLIGLGGRSSPAALRLERGIVNITGNIGPPINESSGLISIGSATNPILNITGIVYGANSTSNAGILISSPSTVNVVGSCVAGNLGIAINNNSSATVTVTRATGNGFGPGSVGMNSIVGLAASQTGITRVYEIEYGTLGQSPTSGPIELLGATSNVAVFATRFGQPKTLVDLNNSVNLVPTSGNVRSGVAYNYNNNTGSCVVPHPNSVVYGVPVDNTVGSGLLSPVAVWNALTNAIGTSGSIAERLKNCSTVSTVGKQLEGVL